MFSTAADNQPAVTIRVLQGEREFAKDNKLLGNFDLVGITPAPRGVPQIEVIFDIDANGIINVSAVDKANNKKQEIRITSGSGLTEEEIQRMVKEADLNRDADKKKREVVDARNHLDSMVFASEKLIKESGDKLPADKKTELEAAINEAKTKLQSENLEEVKAATERLQNISHQLAEFMYSQPGAAPGAENTAQPEAEGSADPSKKKKDDGVVDADFKEV